MHRLVSPFILDKYAAGESSGQFEAASLFVDMSGFSTMTSALMQHGQHGAEVMAQAMRTIFDPLVGAVYAQGGFITVFAGDAFTAVFPFVDGRDGVTPPLPALAAAWAIRSHMAGHSYHETPYGVFEIGVKVGLAMGDVQWGIIRAEDGARAAFYFRGPAIDACAIAEHQAQAGDLIMHPSALAALGDAIQGEEAGGGVRVTGIATILPRPQPVALDPLPPQLLAHFYPRSVIEQTQTGEFRQVVNVFVGLQGEPTFTQMQGFMQTVFRLQDKYGGLLNRLDFGDKGCSLFMFWGAPVSHENDILRALNFLLELHESTRAPIRVGVTSRISHAGFIGSPLHEEYTCYGNGVNLAARFMMSAPWEAIWLDEATKLRAEHLFDLDFEGNFALKGFTEEQSVYALLGYKSGDALNFYSSQMVGRTQELEQLKAFAAPLLTPANVTRYAGVMVVIGEAGIGKSRLVEEFRVSGFGLRSEGIPNPKSTIQNPQWFVAQTDPILNQSLNPFRYWLRSYFEQSPTQSEAHNRRLFSRKLTQLIEATGDAALAEALDQGRSFLGALVDLYWDDSLFGRLDPQSRHENTLIALKTLLMAESLRQPVILLLEDVHWLDEDSAEFMQRLTRNIGHYPIAVLATARPETDQRFFGPNVSYKTLELGNLSTTELGVLAENILAGTPAPALLDMIEIRAGGNPFFAEQIVLYLRDEGLLEQTDIGWAPNTLALQAAPLPANVRAIFTARLDRLSHDVKEVVQTAAVLGREFEVNVLSHMMRGSPNLPDRLMSAEEASIWATLSEIRYIFKHVLLRDAAYDMQVQTRRAALHQLAGESLEALYPEGPDTHLIELAYHFETAYLLGIEGVAAKARMYLTQAAKAAAVRYENVAAISHFTRALALTPAEDRRGRFDLLLARSMVYDTRGERDLERPDLMAMGQLAEELDDNSLRAETALRWANYYEETGQFQDGIAATERALACSTGDIDRQLSAMYLQGSLLYRIADYDSAIAVCEAGLSRARAHNLPLSEADLLTVLSFTLDVQGESARALDALQKAFAVFQSANDRAGMMATLNSIAIAEYGVGRYADASVHFDEAIALARETGRRKSEVRYLGNIGQLAIALGDLRKAQSTLERALFLNREIGNRDSEGINLGNLGVIAAKRGDFDAAQDFFAQSVAVAQEVDDKLLVCETLTYWGLCDVHRGNLDAAMQRCAEALPLARELGSPMHEGLVLMTQGHAHLAAGQPGQALTAYQSSLNVRADMGMPGYVAESRAGIARACWALGKQTEAIDEVNSIIEHLASPNEVIAYNLTGAEDALWIYLTFYHVLGAIDGIRAEEILHRAYDLLQAEAAQFETEAERTQYIGRIAYRREIFAEYRRIAGLPEPEIAPQPVALRPFPDGVDIDSGEFSGLDLSFVDLRGVSLRGADLSNANLRGADFSGADLRRADLSGADVRAAIFSDADLRGADLTDITYDANTRWPAGFTP